MPGVLAEEMEEKEKVFYAAEQHYIYRGGVYQPIHEMEAHVSPVIHRYMRSVEIDGDKGSREASFVGRGRGRGYQNLYRLISYRTAGGCCAYSRKIEYEGSLLKIH